MIHMIQELFGQTLIQKCDFEGVRIPTIATTHSHESRPAVPIVKEAARSVSSQACFYEPAVNRTYAEMAAHYDTAVVPARPRKPRDKAKVEVAVQVATRWIIAKLRNRREVVDGTTGEVRVCQVFVAALGASNYT
jgi:hypothetical protein